MRTPFLIDRQRSTVQTSVLGKRKAEKYIYAFCGCERQELRLYDVDELHDPFELASSL